MPLIRIPNGWKPRGYQMPLWSYLENGGKRAIEIAHRRWGKDDVALHWAAVSAIQRPGTYWHGLPEYAQARKAIWNAVDGHTGKRRIDVAFPHEIRETTNDQEMFIRLKTGSTWQVVGTDRFDSLVGAGPVGYVGSEHALANPSAWGYIRPMLEENNGWAMFITTPRGRNHAKTMYDMARENPRWFAEISDIHKTGALSQEQIDESLTEYIALYGEDIGRAQFEQEYLCSFNAAILGAFYAREMVGVRSDGRIVSDLVALDRPVHRAWDIGVRDDTSIWWFQVVGSRVHILDCYSQSGAGLDHYAEVIKQRRDEHGWQDGIDFVPHDAKVKEWGSGKTRVEQMLTMGLRPQLCVQATKLDGINATRQMLARAVFHARCEEQGIAALEQYRREWDDEKKTFKATEVHDWSSHLSDAARYMALSWRSVQAVVEIEEPKPPRPGMVRPPPVRMPSSGRIAL